MNSTDFLEILKAFLVCAGVFTALWGAYDVFIGGEGPQRSVGIKMIVGGIAFGALSWFTFAAMEQKIASAEAAAGFSETAFYSFQAPHVQQLCATALSFHAAIPQNPLHFLQMAGFAVPAMTAHLSAFFAAFPLL